MNQRFYFLTNSSRGVRLHPLVAGEEGEHRKVEFGVKSYHRVLGVVLSLALFFTSSPILLAGLARDVMSGGGGSAGGKGGAANLQNAGAASASLTATRAREVLKKTDAQVSALKALQANARNLMVPAGTPNGLKLGWLEPKDGFKADGTPITTSWVGAKITSANGANNVDIKQSKQSAYLYWNSFSVGPQTKVNFDQSAGGSSVGNWIAFNRVMGSVNPTQIYGSITAQGQIYILNQNGILFHNSAQVNTHALVASSLPINPYFAGDPLNGITGRGLQNNSDYQFLFSALPETKSPSYAETWSPGIIAANQVGAVVVEEGAQLSAPVSSAGIGGRVMLVGSSVINNGTISTPGGQTILAAGLQVGVNPHPSSDPSLRGLDVYVGKVADATGKKTDLNGTTVGTVINNGLIEMPEGDVAMAGRSITQNGAIDSSTSVSYNGRIDLQAAFNAVVSSSSAGSYYYDNALSGGTTGTVDLRPGSVMRILPDWSSTDTINGSSLALPSIVNIMGQSIHMESGATLYAPGATGASGTFYDMSVAARRNPISSDVSSVSSVLGAGINLTAGNWLRPSTSVFYSQYVLTGVGSTPAGSITVDNNAIISAAGSTDVAAPISENYLTVQLRGVELANSPLQRTGQLRGVNLTLDARLTGSYNGQYWIGTPLGDATGFLNLIYRTVGELTAAGGTIALNAGDSVVLNKGSMLDVSGGWIQYAGGYGSTSKLIYQGHLMDISQATPDRVYSGVYATGTDTETFAKWGVTKTYKSTLDPTQKQWQAGYLSGASGGGITILAPSMALNGSIEGTVVNGPRQIRSSSALSTLASASSLNLQINTGGGLPNSPYHPTLLFTSAPGGTYDSGKIDLNTGFFSQGGIGSLIVNNHDGNIVLPQGVSLAMEPLGSVSLKGANVDLEGDILAPGGVITVQTYDLSYSTLNNLTIKPSVGDPSKGNLIIGGGADLSTAGLFSFNLGPEAYEMPVIVNGGTISLKGYRVAIKKGSLLDISGGGIVGAGTGGTTYGNAGSITIAGGRDTEIDFIHDGTLQLNGTLKGFAGPGATSGSLSITAPAIQIGGSAGNSRVLELNSDFFDTGGFSSFSLTGTGLIGTGANAGVEIPGVTVAAGTQIDPVVQNQFYTPLGRLVDFIQARYFRSAVSFSLKATGVTDPNNGNLPVILGMVDLQAGTGIQLDPQISLANSLATTPTVKTGSLIVSGKVTTVDASLIVPGGLISLSAANAYPQKDSSSHPSAAQVTLQVGSDAVISTAGMVLHRNDPLGLGRDLGAVLPGGSVVLSGNIDLSTGSLVDVSGTAGNIYTPPLNLVSASSPLARSVLDQSQSFFGTTTVDSSGGNIVLSGGEELMVFGTLLGRAGGDMAAGGTLSVSSGRFYNANKGQIADSRDLNLFISQNLAGEQALISSDKASGSSAHGYFAAQTAIGGGFDNLVLGGNVAFNGPVSIMLPGSIKVATGGVISADSGVFLKAPYVALGQPFAPPIAGGLAQSQIFLEGHVAPTFGLGSLTVEAGILDVGNLVLKNIGNAKLDASGGVIRGDGTLDIAGALVLKAAQIYPVTASSFTLAAYNHGATKGSITVEQAGGALPLPLSAVGTLALYASIINQNGTLVAPFGTINLGWDGTGTSPIDPISGAGESGALATLPTASKLVLGPQSVTSVSAIDPITGEGITIPYGVILNQSEWISPTGVDITSAGLPSRGINLSGTSVVTEAGSKVDLRGGGNLTAYEWISGLQGTIDPTLQSEGSWNAGASYSVGDKILYNGSVYTARQASTGQTPSVGLYWSKVTESYAVIPGYSSSLLPFSAFADPTKTGGDPGYTSSSLSVGDKISLAGGGGLPAGTYTLLPSRYATLPGAYLITPENTAQGYHPGSVVQTDGSAVVAGYKYNSLNPASSIPTLAALYEVDSPTVLAQKANYQLSLASDFLPGTQSASPVYNAASLVIRATAAMQLMGGVMGSGAGVGRGANIDLSSSANFLITGSGSASTPANTILLNASVLSGWDAGSLLIGGTRSITASGITITPTTSEITIDDAGSTLSAADLILASKDGVIVNDGSLLSAKGSESAAAITIKGDGALLRLSSDQNASLTRTGFDNTSIQGYSIGAGAKLSAASLTLDSSGNASISSTAMLDGKAINLNAGKIALNFDGSSEANALNLAGNALKSLSAAQSLNLTSYSTIDFHGSGVLGSASLASLGLHAGEILGDNGSSDSILASKILLDNAKSSTDPSAGSPSATGGRLTIAGSILTLGSGNLSVGGFQNIAATMSGGIEGQGKGGLTVAQNLALKTPLITGAGSAATAITAGGDLNVTSTGSSVLQPAFGASLSLKGASVEVGAPVVLPSGSLSIEAVGSDVKISSALNVGGISKRFFDVTKYTDAGALALSSDNGNIILASSSTLNLSAQSAAANAGNLSLTAPSGTTTFSGTINATAPNGIAGSFRMDVKNYDGGDLSPLETKLTSEGFTQSQDIRIRSGDVTLAKIKSHNYTLSADQGSITVNGTIDASGVTGGSISLFGGQSVILDPTAILTVHGQQYSHAGKGGSIDLEAGSDSSAIIAVSAPGSTFVSGTSVVDLQSGAKLDLGVDAPVSLGQASGTLHLRAPQTADSTDVQVNPIGSTITGASAITIEGFHTQDAATAGVASIDSYEQGALNNATTFMANYSSVGARISGVLGSANASFLQVNPGEVIKNSLGGLILNNDWDLSLARFGDVLTVLDASGKPVAYTGSGPQDANGNQAIGRDAGFLTLAAKGDITFHGAISDGFGDSVNNAANIPDLSGNIDGLYFAPLLPVVADQKGNLFSQSSWSYRIVAGADLSSANPLSVVRAGGSVKLGVPTKNSNASANPISGGSTGATINELTGNYQVIRTGTGNISVAAGGNIQLLNQFATIYTAGTQAIDQTLGGRFDVPGVIPFPVSENLGAYPQPSLYPAQFALGGGNVSLDAMGNIEHLQLASDGVSFIADSSRQLPSNWLERRGQLNANGNWETLEGFVSPEIASTAWWVNYANFFEGVGALGGGDVSMVAGGDISNVDAVIPTQGRVTARDTKGNQLTAAQGTLVETGGGDLTVKTGGNLDAGVYYVERGNATLKVAGSIVSNRTRDASGNYVYSLLDPNNSAYANPDPATWLPTSFFLGQGNITVTAGGDALLGPVGNVFMMPQSINNGADYKTYFSSYDTSSSFTVTSLGGSVAFRTELRTQSRAFPAFQAWAVSDGVVSNPGAIEAGAYQPWIRTIETSPGDVNLTAGTSLLPGSIAITSFSGNISLQGNMTLAPAPSGELAIYASGSINGVYQQQQGQAWSTSVVNISDTALASIPSVLAPLSQSLDSGGISILETATGYLGGLTLALTETASTTGVNGALQGKIARHDQNVLHSGDTQPVRLYAEGGDLSGLQLFSPKATDVLVGGDITDMSFSIQNLTSTDVSIVSAAGTMTLYDPNSLSLTQAEQDLVNLAANSPFRPQPRSGDIQVSGPGTLEVLAGGNLDLGAGDPNSDGTGAGITSIGNARNPALPFAGADIIAVAGISLPTGLSSSGLNTTALLNKLSSITDASRYFGELQASLLKGGNDGLGNLLESESITSIAGITASSLSEDEKARLALSLFYIVLRDAGRDHNNIGSPGYGHYTAGEEAIATFLKTTSTGDILVNHRYIDTKSGGEISLLSPGGKISISPTTPSSDYPLPGVVTEHGGGINIYSQQSVSMPFGRIFTLLGGDIVIWSDKGDIAAGSSSKTVASAPPTRVLIDPQSGDVLTDLSGLATGGGIGVLATVKDAPIGNVDLIAPSGVIDAGDAGIRSSGNLNLAATKILNADNIAASGSTAGAPPAAPPPAAPNISGASAAAAAGAANSTAAENSTKSSTAGDTAELPASIISVEVLGYGGGDDTDDDSNKKPTTSTGSSAPPQAAL